MALLPDLRFQSDVLRQLEADAIQLGRSPAGAARKYVRQRSHELDVALADCEYLESRSDEWDNDEFVDARAASLSQSVASLPRIKSLR